MRNHTTLCLLALAAVLALAAAPAGAANIVIINNDGPNEGFNDPDMPDPTWGCPDGMTLGQCRLNAFQAAADRWGELLQSNVDILVSAQMNPMTCSGGGAVLGSSGTTTVMRDFPGAPFPGTWYHSALADALAGYDVNAGVSDITSQFNSNLDDDPTCTLNWWYGTDGDFPGNWATNPDANATHFFAVVMHELAHGLGFQDFVNLQNGQFLGGYPDVYSKFTFDVTLGLHWDEMTAQQRAASALNTGNVVLDGPQDKAVADVFLTADDVLFEVNTGPAAGGYAGKGAQYGGSYIATDGLTLPMEVVNDGVGTTNDGCEPLVGFTAGNIAFIDRGTCQFGLKALNAEEAGAAGVVIANNQGGTAIVLMAPGEFGRAVTVPVIAINQDDGNFVRPTLPQSGTFDVIDVNGLHANGFPLLYTPAVLELGSTISHYDITAAPSALMEPAVNLDLFNDPDMTLGMYRDEGWIVGLLFADGFESGDFAAWSAFVP
jgi:hypothetical protein